MIRGAVHKTVRSAVSISAANRPGGVSVCGLFLPVTRVQSFHQEGIRPTSTQASPTTMMATTTQVRNFAVASRSSRKKKNAAGGGGEGGQMYDFVGEAQKLLEVVHEALLPFQAPVNEGFILSTISDVGDVKGMHEVELLCGEGKGRFQFQIDAKNKVLNASTPVSGALQYYFNGDSWLNVHDDHDIRGIIVRDMLRLTSSAPKL